MRIATFAPVILKPRGEVRLKRFTFAVMSMFSPAAHAESMNSSLLIAWAGNKIF